MHLYLSEAPRTLYLVTGSQDEKIGRPRRALVFRTSPTNSSQAVVEFLQKDDVDLSNAIPITSRVVKGCLGLINVAGGEYMLESLPSAYILIGTRRHILGGSDVCGRCWKYQAVSCIPGIRCQDP